MLAEGRCARPDAMFVEYVNWSLGGEVEVIGMFPSTKKHTPRRFRPRLAHDMGEIWLWYPDGQEFNS
jgi:hypothetical protein